MGKYKRLYIGGASLLTITGLFIVLISLGLTITSDGDKHCSGTIEDPCISYLTINNPTAKSIYIYNKEDIKLDFSPEIKSYELYVKYYGKWVYTNFTMSTRLSNIPEDALYVFVFPRYSKKEFKLVGYKNNPGDVIKWGMGVEDDYLDPVWYGNEDWIIDGDKVYVNDNNIYFSAEPHSITGSADVTFNLISKVYNGDIDIVFGFDDANLKVSNPRYYNPHNVTTEHNYSCVHKFNYTLNPNYAWCYTITEENIGSNETPILANVTTTVFEHSFISGNIPTQTIFWSETVVEDYVKLSNVFDKVNFEHGGMNTWFVKKNFNVNQGQEYELKIKIDVPVRLGSYSGKYWVGMKPSGETLQEAVVSGHLYVLDPWWNSSYVYRRVINCSGMTDGVPLVINGSVGFVIGGVTQYVWTYCQGQATALYYNDNTDYVVANDTAQIPHEVENGTGTSYNPSSVWSDYTAVWHLNNLSGSVNPSHLLTLVGTVNSVTGKIGGAYYFDGSTDYLYDGTISLSTTGHTIEAWVNITDFLDYRGIIGSRRAIPDGKTTYSYFVDKINGLPSSYDNLQEVNANTSITAGNYVLLSFVKSGSNVYFYLNNTAVGSGSQTNQVPPLTGMNTTIGDARSIGDGSDEFKGDIDEIRLSNKTRDIAYFTQVYNNVIGLSGYGDIGAEETGIIPDTENPRVTLSSPADNNVTLNLTPQFSFTSTDETATTTACNLYLNSSLYGQNLTTLNNTLTSITANNSLVYGNYNWSVSCFDGVNTNRSVGRSINIGVTMNGTVKNSAGTLIENAVVVLWNQSSNSTVTVLTSNSSGKWSYPFVPAGTYAVFVYHPTNTTVGGSADPHITIT